MLFDLKALKSLYKDQKITPSTKPLTTLFKRLLMWLFSAFFHSKLETNLKTSVNCGVPNQLLLFWYAWLYDHNITRLEKEVWIWLVVTIVITCFTIIVTWCAPKNIQYFVFRSKVKSPMTNLLCVSKTCWMLLRDANLLLNRINWRRSSCAARAKLRLLASYMLFIVLLGDANSLRWRAIWIYVQVHDTENH